MKIGRIGEICMKPSMDDYNEHFVPATLELETTSLTLNECKTCRALVSHTVGHRQWHLERERDWKRIWDHVSSMPGGI